MENYVDRLLKAIGIFIFAVGGYITLFDSMGDDLKRILLFIAVIVISFMVMGKIENTVFGWNKGKSEVAIFALFMAVPYTVLLTLFWMIFYGIASTLFSFFADYSLASILAEHDIEERFGSTFYLANYVICFGFLCLQPEG
tara:strand:+ start:1027 stop:1449 length:423 start_codon:yes stop_codon:yes gene_type:complete